MRRIIRYFLFLYTVGIFSLSLLSSSEVNKLPFSSLWDKVSHTIEYALWGIFASIFLSVKRSDENTIYVVILSAVIGVIDETIQTTSFGRTASFWDFCVDVFGAFIGTVIFYLISKSFSKN